MVRVSAAGFRLRIVAALQASLIIASLFTPIAVLASITSVSIGAQTPNPVTAGNSATYQVTSVTDTNRATVITAVSGLPAGATWSSDCVISTSTGSVSNTLTISTTVATPAGSTTFTPTVTARANANCGNSSVNATNSSASATLVVAAPVLVAQTITFPALAGVRLDEAAPVPAATASSGLAVTYATASAACSVTSGGVITLLHAGTCTIDADQAGNATYSAAPQVSRSFTVAKGDQSITFGALADATLADSPLTIGASASSGLGVAFGSTTPAVCTVAGTQVTLVATGTCTITADQAGDADWNAAAQVTRSFTVSALAQTITFPALAGVRLDEAAPVPAATASSGLAVTYATASAACSVTSGGVITLLHAGTCTIDADQAGNATYSAAPQVSRSFTVAKGDQSITFGALADATYGDPPVTANASASSGLGVSRSSLTPAACSVSGSTVTILSAGTCSVQANQAGDADWNAAPAQTQSFAIAQATQSITFAPLADVTTTGGGFELDATSDSGLPVSYTSLTPSVCTVSGTTVTFTGVGTCTIRADQAGDTNVAPAAAVTRSFRVLAASGTTPETSTTVRAGPGDGSGAIPAAMLLWLLAIGVLTFLIAVAARQPDGSGDRRV